MSQHRNGKRSLSGPESVMEGNIDRTGAKMRKRDREGGGESHLHQTDADKEAKGVQP